MNDFWVVTLFHLQSSVQQRAELVSLALENLNALGAEEFSLNEPEVDALLGERSYSGGDLPEEILDEVEEKVLNRPGTFRYFFEDEESANSFYQHVKEHYLCEAQLERQPAQDWNAEWKKHYSAIEVNDELTILPSWEIGKQHKGRYSVAIHPGMGFGTGSHETTFLCLKLFTEHLLHKNIRGVLDFGSGSGILGLAALKFFPELKVDFYDIDPEANKNCYENAKLNGLENCAFRLLLPEYRDKLLSSYDVVFANILENILLLERDQLVSMTAPGGSLILSGILTHQAPAVIQAYSPHLELIQRLDKGDWSALLFQRKE